MKVLRVCSSEVLPPEPERDTNYIYFCYDNLKIYSGKNFHSDPYCVVESIPSAAENPDAGIFYITLTGDIMVYRDYVWVTIAQIEDPAQLIHLEKVGTMFFTKSGYTYLDKQKKRLSIPYQNGSYQLSVNLNREIKIDNATIMKYNEETGQFEIDGGRYYDEFGRNPEIMHYHGGETSSARTTINDDHLTVDVKLSSAAGNILEAKTNGLYAAIDKVAKEQDLTELQNAFSAYKTVFDKYKEDIATALEALDITLKDDTLSDIIKNNITDSLPYMDRMFRQYNYIYDDMDRFRTEIRNTVDSEVEETKTEVINRIKDIPKSWGYFSDIFECIVKEGSTVGTCNITAKIELESSKVLGYKIGHKYLYENENVDDFELFENGSDITAPDNTKITICYGTNVGTDSAPIIKVNSCSYCISKSKE